MEKKDIPWVRITDSSQIIGVYWYAKTETLYIKFKNRKEYSYSDVSFEEYQEFIGAQSLGSYFHTNIKNEKTWASI